MNIFDKFTTDMLAALPKSKSPKKTKRGRSSPNVDMEEHEAPPIRRSTRSTTRAKTTEATRKAEIAAIETKKKRVMRALKNDDPTVITPTPTPKPKPKPTPKPTPSRPQSAPAPHARGRVIKPSSTKDKILSRINVTPSTIRKNNQISSKNAIEKFKIQLKQNKLTEAKLLELFANFTNSYFNHFGDNMNDIKQAILSRRRTNDINKEIKIFEKENQTFISKKEKLNKIMSKFNFDTELAKVLKVVEFSAVKAALKNINEKIKTKNTKFFKNEYKNYVQGKKSLLDDFCKDVQNVFQDPTISTDKLNQLKDLDSNIHIAYLHMLNVHANNKCNEFKTLMIELHTTRASIFKELEDKQRKKITNMETF